MNTAFDKLIRSGNVDSVGELAIAVRVDKAGFRYCPTTFVGGGYGQIRVASGRPTLVDFGTPESGTFDWALLPCDDYPAVGLFFSGAGHGLVFAPARYDDPQKIAAASQSEFTGRAFDLTELRLQRGIEYSRQAVHPPQEA